MRLVFDIGCLFPTTQASRFERLLMQRTTVFVFELIQYAMIAVRCTLPAVSEGGVIATGDRRVEQRCAQYTFRQT